MFEFNLFGEKVEDLEKPTKKEACKETKKGAKVKNQTKKETNKTSKPVSKDKSLPKDRPLQVCYAREQIEYTLEERAELQKEAKDAKVEEFEIIRRQLNRMFPELSEERVTWHWIGDSEEETREELVKRAETKVDEAFKAKRPAPKEEEPIAEFRPIEVQGGKIYVQASENQRCSPKVNLDTLGEYEEVELTLDGMDLDDTAELEEYKDGDTNVYGNVPIEAAKKALVSIIAGPKPVKEDNKDEGPMIVVPVITAGKKG